MSIFNTLQTAVSGMAAQASRLGTIGDNIANAGTTGYKDANVEFQTLLGSSGSTYYESGGVQSRVRYEVSKAGTISSTASTTDLAIKGDGFFVVQTNGTATALTRAGSFVADSTGDLVNTAGFKLMGYDLTDGSFSTSTGIGTLQPVNISAQGLTATPSTSGSFKPNLPSTADVVTDLPSANAATATFTAKTSFTAYDNLGTQVNLDVYMSKTAANAWEVTVYNSADAAAGGGFPYANAALTTQALTFDPTTGRLAAGSARGLSVPIPNGSTVAIDMSSTTQLAANYEPTPGNITGSSPSKVQSVAIGTDGTVSIVYQNGTTKPTFRIPLADVPSPDHMTVVSGNIYQPNSESGDMSVGSAKTGTLGEIDSNSLESSTVDLASQLTLMIATQRSYEANSKVLTTGADMLNTIIQAIRG